MKKKDIRDIYKRKRAELDDATRKSHNDLIYKRFRKISLPKLYYLHHYLPIHTHYEIPIQRMVDDLIASNPNLIQIVPVVKGLEMLAVIYNNGMEVKKNQWGIDEPIDLAYADISKIDCVFVPLIAFDLKGYRVGYGKGYYDRFLARCNPDVIKIGFSNFEPIDEISDTDKFDIPLNYCITPGRIYEFG